jgi:hypothetical protein
MNPVAAVERIEELEREIAVLRERIEVLVWETT